MTNHEKGLKKDKTEGIHSLKKDFLLRLALLGHARKPTDHVAAIQDINREIERVRAEFLVIEEGSAEEDACMERLRSLEDERFQLLSRMNGDRVHEYNILAPRY